MHMQRLRNHPKTKQTDTGGAFLLFFFSFPSVFLRRGGGEFFLLRSAAFHSDGNMDSASSFPLFPTSVLPPRFTFSALSAFSSSFPFPFPQKRMLILFVFFLFLPFSCRRHPPRTDDCLPLPDCPLSVFPSFSFFSFFRRRISSS